MPVINRIILYAISVLFPIVSYAQETPSLSYLLQQSKTDEERLEAYNKLFKELEFSNNDSLIYYLQRGLNDFKKSGYLKGQASLLSLLGSAYSIKGMQPMATAQSEASLKLFEKLGDSNAMATVHNSLGIISGKNGNYNTALEHFYTALKLFEAKGNKEGIVKTYIKLGVAYELSDNLDKGLSYYEKALALQKNKPSGDLITLYNNIGSLYCRKGEFQTALPYFEKALELASSEQFKQMRGFPLLNIGKVYLELGNKEQGKKYLFAALENTRQENLPDQESRILLNIATITEDQEDAIRYMNQALQIAQSLGDRRLQLETMEVLYFFYKDRKDFEKALHYFELHSVIEDSIFNVDKEKEIANLQSVYELEKSNVKIDELEAANKKNAYFRNIIIGIACVLGCLLILSSLFLWRIRNLNAKILINKQALKKANDDKDRLFSVIGHDLRNHVANVPIVLEMYEDDTLSPEEKKFLLSSLKDNSLATLETLEKLLNWGKSQLKGITAMPAAFYAKDNIVNKLRLMKNACDQKQITLKDLVDEDIRVYADEEHFKFIVRNLLSNAVKYTHTGGTIEINAFRQEEDVVFSVKDNGIGMTETQQEQIFEPFTISTEGTDREKGNGIGLMLCKEFISKNKGRIWVESEKGKGTTFYFSLKSAAA